MRRIALASLVLIGAGVFFVVISLWQLLATPLARAEGELPSNEAFSQDRPYTVLIMLLEYPGKLSPISSISVLRVNPVQQTAAVVSIPSDVPIPLGSTHGEAAISELYALGGVTPIPDRLIGNNIAEKSGNNIGFTAVMISRALALPIDRYVLIDAEGWADIQESLGSSATWDDRAALFRLRSIGALPRVLPVIREHIKTDFTPSELWELAQTVLIMRDDKLTKIEITKQMMKQTETLDRTLVTVGTDPAIFEERVSVQVLNGTQTSGLATLVSRFVENSGARVVGVGNTLEQHSDRSYIIARDPERYSVKRIAHMLNIEEIRPFDSAYGVRDRADVSIIIGLDKVME